jgi:calcineurin-like phosphoesterase family protein
MRFFTADLHLGAPDVIDFCDRPYRSVDEMDFALIDNWNAIVFPADEVWVLGDLAMGRLEVSLERASLLHGEKHLVTGNHDRCWAGGKKDWKKWVSLYEEAGFMVHNHLPGATLKVGEFRVCHFPPLEPTIDHKSDRYLAWRPTDGPLLHGHIHDGWRNHPQHPWTNVGVDVWDYAPVTEARLLLERLSSYTI